MLLCLSVVVVLSIPLTWGASLLFLVPPIVLLVAWAWLRENSGRREHALLATTGITLFIGLIAVLALGNSSWK